MINLYTLKKEIKDNVIYYASTLFLYLIGIAAGIAVARNINLSTDHSISVYLSSAFEMLKTSQINRVKVFGNSCLRNMSFFVTIILLGYTRFGFIIVSILIIIKGVFTGFTFLSLIVSFSFFKVTLILLFLLPSTLLLIVALLETCKLSLNSSFSKLTFKRHQQYLMIKSNSNRYLFLQAQMTFLVILAVLWDAFVVPLLL